MAEKAQRTRQTNETARKGGPTKPVAQKPVAQVQQADLGTLQRAVVNPRVARPSDILALQRTVGNQAVTRLIQTKLTVGSAGDRYEQEADRVAEQVMTMPAPRSAPSSVQRAAEEEEEVQTRPLTTFITPLVQRQAAPEEEEVQTKSLVQRQEVPEEEEVQTKSLVQRRGDGSFEASPELESRLAAHKGGGSPLPEDVRAYMEPRFGADFSGVRVHTGGEAAQLNRALSAQAFTHGRDIYLGEGRYDPDSDAGKRLLAHELAHTLQQGASKRIAGWWADGHKMITLTTGYEQKAYDASIIDWVADHAGSQDVTMRSITNFAIWAGFKQKGAKKKYESKDTTLLEKKKLWQTGGLMVRMGAERPFHGEASAYQDGANNTADNIKAVDNQIRKAQSAYKKGFYREGLLQLSDALHTAEDRGSHGEGLAWAGHDPRLALPQKWDGSVNENYRPSWDCDNVAKNAGGRVLAEKYAKKAFQDFVDGLDMGEKLKLSMGIGAQKTDFNWGRDWGSRLFHGFRHTIGGIAGLVGEKKLEPAEDKLRNLEEYKKIKEKYPSIEPEDLEQLATSGERGTESKRGFEKYKQVHLSEVRESIKNQLMKIIQSVNGNVDPFSMESKYKLFSTLQKTARDYDSTIAGIDAKSDERTLVAQLIEQDAARWRETAEKYSSLTRKVFRRGRNDQKQALIEDIKVKAPEHLAFVAARSL
jgi:hypothetical protein